MIPFARPYFDDQVMDNILAGMKQVLQSGMLTNSVNVRNVESFFSSILANHHVVATNSCTASLHLAMILSEVSKGDEVIVPSNTFVSTANAVLFCNAKPVFAEIDPDTLNINPADIEERITDRTKAIVPVHLAGKPCDMDALSKISEKHGLTLIEDCAHAHGSMYKGRPCGTFGTLSCFSFYPTKVIASAEGGLLVSPDEHIINRASVLLNQGRVGIGPNEIQEIGYNYRMNELQAVIIAEQMRFLDRIIADRKKIADIYRNRLREVDNIELISEEDYERNSYYSFAIRISDVSRDAVRDRLLAEGIQTSIMYHPVHLQPVYRRLFGYTEGSLPITEKTSKQILNLPMYNGLKEEEIHFICDKLEEIVNDLPPSNQR